ncbi:MAG: hypothetical protein U5R06_19030 [candidate division KSB1 bacterium]|nr:hypothetical protein [candidate division KSB1 bacterium]
MTEQHQQLSPEEAIEQIQHIRNTMAQASKRFFMSAWQWIEWGILIIIGGLITLYLVHQDKSEHITFIWIAIFILGGALETIIWYRGAQDRGINPLQPFSMKICGVLFALMMVGIFYTLIFVELSLPLYIPGLWMLVSGLCIFMMVILGDRRDLVLMGSVQVISGILASSVLLDYSIQVGTVSFGFGSIVMGFYQLYNEKKQRSVS